MTTAERMILFVCTGNTCRSPMAQAIAQNLLSQSPTQASVTVRSAGVSAIDGAPASVHAAKVMQRRGIDLTAHRSTALSTDLVAKAHTVFAMTPAHAQAVVRLAPDAEHKVYLLDPTSPVPDPFGLPVEEYEHTAARLEELVRQRLTELDA